MIVTSLLISCLVVAVASKGSNNIHVETKYFTLTVTGNQNVPKYTYFVNSKPEDSYRLQFSQMFECIPDNSDCKKFGKSNIALASLNWEFSDVIETENETTFTIESGKVNNRFDNLQFVQHLAAVQDQNSNDTLEFETIDTRDEENDNYTNYIKTSFKFDVIVSNYQWVSTNPNAKLVLIFNAQQENGQQDKSFFGIESTANDGEIEVSLAQQGKNYIIIYDHFTGSLNHDPLVGIMYEFPITTSTGNDESTGSDELNSSAISLTSSVCGLISITVALLLLL